MIRSIAAIAAVCGVAAFASAQTSFTGTPLGFDFNSLASSGTQTPFTVLPAGTQAVVPNSGGWVVTRLSGTSTSTMPYLVDTGGNNGGAIYSYGATGSSERALGSLASNAQVPAFGLEITNNASNSITDIVITFDGEQYRSSTVTANLLAFAWGTSTGGATSANFLSATSGMTALAAGNILGAAPVATNGAITPIITAYSVTLTGLTLGVGESLFLRWQDANEGGNDAGLAIDNFNFSANVIPTPGALALLGLGMGIAARRRRA